MIATAALLALAQAPVAAPEPAVVTYNRALTFADLALTTARQRICERRVRERRVVELEVRLRSLVVRAQPVFGDSGQPLSLVEPEPDGPDCARFGQSVRAAVKALDEAEAILADAAREGN